MAVLIASGAHLKSPLRFDLNSTDFERNGKKKKGD
jgi:hypothetical protein